MPIYGYVAKFCGLLAFHFDLQARTIKNHTRLFNFVDIMIITKSSYSIIISYCIENQPWGYVVSNSTAMSRSKINFSHVLVALLVISHIIGTH